MTKPLDPREIVTIQKIAISVRMKLRRSLRSLRERGSSARRSCWRKLRELGQEVGLREKETKVKEDFLAKKKRFINLLFGKAGMGYVSRLHLISEALVDYEYDLMASEQYKKSAEKNPIEAMRLYWLDVLSRCHLVASVTLLRQKRWIEGTIEAAEAGNFILFAAAFKGLIESAVDSQDVLQTVPHTLAHLYRKIKSALEGKLSEEVLLPKEVEEKLIQFSYARLRTSEGTEFPDSHSSTTTTEYLRKLQRAEDGPIIECYSVLLKMTDASGLSVLSFLTFHGEEKFMLNSRGDFEQIKSFCKHYEQIIPSILQMSVNFALFTLKVINYFPVAKLKTPALERMSLDDLPAWTRIEETVTEQVLLR